MDLNKLNYDISRSHKFWGRKPISTLLDIFFNINEKDIFIDPFCGSGSSVLAALMKKAKVIASDINPMAIFLTKVLVNPINIPTLIQKFEELKDNVSAQILSTYKINCPRCGESSICDFVVWNEIKPFQARIKCPICKNNFFLDLNEEDSKEITRLSEVKPKFWYPQTEIRSFRNTPVKYHYELFTSRNLANLSFLLNEINRIEPVIYKEALLYVFSAILYSVSKMQMFSKKQPLSSRGWTALRYYIPTYKKEKNVWMAFESRFGNFIKLKQKLNQLAPDVRLKESYDSDFLFNNEFNVALFKADIFDPSYKIPKESSFIFLDPPYKDELEYNRLSEFWGIWFSYNFDFESISHFTIKDANIYSESLNKILASIHKRTNERAKVLLAFGCENQTIFEKIVNIIDENGFQIDYHQSGQFIYDIKNSIKKISQRTDHYFFLTGKEPDHLLVSNSSLKDKRPEERIIQYAAVIKYLEDANLDINIDKLLNKTSRIIPINYRVILEDKLINSQNFRLRLNRQLNKANNIRSFNTLCANVLELIFRKSDLQVCYINYKVFHKSWLKLKKNSNSELSREKKITDKCAMILKNHGTTFIINFDNQDSSIITELARIVYRIDKNNFKILNVVVFKNNETLNKARSIESYNLYKRTFFTSFEQICLKSKEIDPDQYTDLVSAKWISKKNRNSDGVNLHKVKVLENIRVGRADSKLYKLRFEANKSLDIGPGQFVMIDTIKDKNILYRSFKSKTVNSFNQISPSINNDLTRDPNSFLKRPFGIHRTYYKDFENKYLEKLDLPKILANILYTIKPYQFEILYKVVEGGVGTNEMTKIRKSDLIEILSPLGKIFDLREKIKDNIDEVHIIGGGVGIAPLVYIAQALRYFNIKTRAFIGIESYESLIHQDNVAYSFAGTDKHAKIYVDDLILLGLNEKDDIFVSFQDNKPITGMDIKKGFAGRLISDVYSDELSENYLQRDKKIIAFSCGPFPMMKKIHELTLNYGIQLYVLMEKRMACGIGVCFSCVCKTLNDNEKNYTRVCIEGPIFESTKINWNDE